MKTLEKDSFESNDTFMTCYTQPQSSPTVSFGLLDKCEHLTPDAAVLDRICQELSNDKLTTLTSESFHTFEQSSNYPKEHEHQQTVKKQYPKTLTLPKWFTSKAKSKSI